MSVSIPKVNLKVEEDDTSSLGEISTLAVGYGLHQAWVYAAMFGASSVFGVSVNTNGHISSPVFIISIITFAISLVFIGLLDQKLLKVLVEKRTMATAAALTCLGTLLVLFCADTSIGLVLSFIAGISTGFGSAVFICFWGTAFARNTIPSIAINTALAVVVAIAVYALLLHWVPVPLSGILAALLPIGSLFFLWQHTPASYIKRHDVPLFQPLPIHKSMFFIRMTIPMILFGFALGYMRGNITGDVLPNADPVSHALLLLVASVLVLMAFLVTIAFTPDEDALAISRALIAPIGLTIIAIPFADNGLEWAVVSVIAGYMMFEALMWTYMGSLSQEYGISPIAVFGISRGMLAAGAIIGSAIGATFTSALTAVSGGGVTGISALIVGLLLAFCSLPTFRTIRRMIKPEKAEWTAIDEINESNELKNEKESVADEEFVTEDGFKGGRFRKRCELVANHYLLSRRESEVLFFLAKGHNAAYIQEKLFISEGTAKTHIRHIYKKTNVHNQQELMRAVESAEEDLA